MESKLKKGTAEILLYLLIIAGLVILGVYLSILLLDPLDCRMAPGASVGGLDIGGMTRQEARTALKEQAEGELLAHELKVQALGKTLIFTPEALEMELDTAAAVKDAYRMGRREDVRDLPLRNYLSLSEDALRATLESFARENNTELTQPQWSLSGQTPQLGEQEWEENAPGQTLLLTMGIPEQNLDPQDAFDDIMAFYDHPFGREYRLTLETAAIREPEMPDLEQIFTDSRIAPVDASLDLTTYALIPGSYGYHMDAEAAKAAVETALWGQTLSIPMVYEKPAVLGEEAYFRDVLGDCDTKHSDNENRNTNLRLLCELLNGQIIQPGEEFSYNNAVGERTPERGFKPAPAYSGDRLTQDYGGGVCQGSTTLYNCLLEGDMEILERHGHGALVSYIELGLDAAVNWSTKTDLIFRNNSHFPVKILAEVSDGYVKMKLMGTDEKDYYIVMEASQTHEEDYAYAVSYKCKYDKATGERISREREAFSTYDKSVG